MADANLSGQSRAVSRVQASFELLNALGSAWIIALMLAVCADVAGRTLLSRPIDGVAEFSALSIVCIVFMQLPAAVAARRLTRADALLSRLWREAPGVAKTVELVWTVVSMAVFAGIAYSAALPMLRAHQRGDFIGVEGLFTFPTWIVWAVIEVGAILSVLAYMLRLKVVPPVDELEVSHV